MVERRGALFIAYLLAITTPEERSRAISTTNTARYMTRPLGALAGGGVAAIAIGAPLVAAAAVKVTYDAAVWRTFRDVPLLDDQKVVAA